MTIAVDTSALIAILYGEPERDRFRRLLDATSVISAGNMIELVSVVMRRTPHLVGDTRSVLAALGIPIGEDRAPLKLQ